MKFKLPIYFLYSLLIGFLLFACASTGKGTEEPLTVEAPEELEATVEIVSVPVLQSESFYIGEDVLESEKTYNYEGTRLTSIDMTNSFGEPVEEVRFEYGQTDQPVKRSVYGPEGTLASVRVYTYDEQGNLVREELYNRNDQLQTISEYEYDQDGRRLRWTVKDGGGSLMAYTEYVYEDGNNTRINTFSADGLLRDYFIRTFSKDKLILEEKFNEKGGSAGKVEYNYSGDRLVREDVFRSNGSLERSVDYEYDDKASVVKEIYLRADDTVEQLIVRTYNYREEERAIEK
ncbi:RHS repeat domain-containing protein [Marispirochaeta sp.]|jgi:YD repeat-containing protein|uniref:RHS repeat domain-containing protein n=1 Tax=Marispirochaeta sp. TaxID=2038653 RepID=UPI0029C6C8A0|nr:RHS repeat domain-containing protein [Marispirochaeta sp.]